MKICFLTPGYKCTVTTLRNTKSTEPLVLSYIRWSGKDRTSFAGQCCVTLDLEHNVRKRNSNDRTFDLSKEIKTNFKMLPY